MYAYWSVPLGDINKTFKIMASPLQRSEILVNVFNIISLDKSLVTRHLKWCQPCVSILTSKLYMRISRIIDSRFIRQMALLATLQKKPRIFMLFSWSHVLGHGTRNDLEHFGDVPDHNLGARVSFLFFEGFLSVSNIRKHVSEFSSNCPQSWNIGQGTINNWQ